MLKEDDLVLCTVKRIEGTTVFVEIEGNGEGSLVMSEIAAGRIRNLREYVAPNKKIVCKILKIVNGYPQLSLRRVTSKEKLGVIEKSQKERTFSSLIRSVAKNPEEALSKIKEKHELCNFSDESRENPKILEEFFSKEEASALQKIFSEKKDKEKTVMKTFILKSNSDSGIEDIREILSTKEAEIKYLGSSNFSLTVKAKDFKDANLTAQRILQKIDSKAKEKKAILEIKE